MKVIAAATAIVALSAVLSGCAQIFGVQSQNATTLNIDKMPQAIIMPADKRAIIVRTGPGGGTVGCAEPAPDVATSTLSAAAAKLAASADTLGSVAKPEVTADLSSNLATTAAELNGRNSTVLLARDFLFRLCELSTNYRPGSAEYTAAAGQFDKVVKVIKDLSEAAKSQAAAQEKTASAQDAQAKTALVKAQADATLIVTALQAKIDVVLAKVTKEGKITLADLQTLVGKVPANVLEDEGRRKILAAVSPNNLRGILSDMGDEVVSPMWLAAKS